MNKLAPHVRRSDCRDNQDIFYAGYLIVERTVTLFLKRKSHKNNYHVTRILEFITETLLLKQTFGANKPLVLSSCKKTLKCVDVSYMD